MGFVSQLDIEQFGGKEQRKSAFGPDSELGKRLRRLTPAVQIGNPQVGTVVFSHAGFAPGQKTPVRLEEKFKTVKGYNEEIMSHIDEGLPVDQWYGNVAYLPTGNRVYTALVEREKSPGVKGPEDKTTCNEAKAAAKRFGATILVNGHNPDKTNHKIIKACDGLVYSIDAAMSRWITMPYLGPSDGEVSAWKEFKPTGTLYPAYLEIDFTSGKPVATPHDGVAIQKQGFTQPPEISLSRSGGKLSGSGGNDGPMIHGPNVGGMGPSTLGPNVGTLGDQPMDTTGDMGSSLRSSPHGNFIS